MTLPRPTSFKVGDIVRLRDTLVDGGHPWAEQKMHPELMAGDVGVVSEARGFGFYVTFARTGPCPAGWGPSRFDLMERPDDN